jgi:hypothetical protein
VSDIPENACVVGKDGFTFRNRDTDHLREVLGSLLEHAEVLSAFGERCRLRAERFRWPQVANELEAVYRSVVEVCPTESVSIEEPETAQGRPQADVVPSEVLEELPVNSSYSASCS